MVGVLTTGELDDGQGSARTLVMRHVHELESGKTSCISQQVLGYSADGTLLNWERDDFAPRAAELSLSDSSRILTLLDLCGQERYLKTTLFGLAALVPDYAVVCISATSTCAHGGGVNGVGVNGVGVNGVGVNGVGSVIAPTARLHISLAAALRLPLVVVITKGDKCDEAARERLTAQVAQLLEAHGVAPPRLVRCARDAEEALEALVESNSLPLTPPHPTLIPTPTPTPTPTPIPTGEMPHPQKGSSARGSATCEAGGVIAPPPVLPTWAALGAIGAIRVEPKTSEVPRPQCAPPRPAQGAFPVRMPPPPPGVRATPLVVTSARTGHGLSLLSEVLRRLPARDWSGARAAPLLVSVDGCHADVCEGELQLKHDDPLTSTPTQEMAHVDKDPVVSATVLFGALHATVGAGALSVPGSTARSRRGAGQTPLLMPSTPSPKTSRTCAISDTITSSKYTPTTEYITAEEPPPVEGKAARKAGGGQAGAASSPSLSPAAESVSPTTAAATRPLLIGPDAQGCWAPASVVSIRYKKLTVAKAEAGQSATFRLQVHGAHTKLRRGMVLIDATVWPLPKAHWEFEAEVTALLP